MMLDQNATLIRKAAKFAEERHRTQVRKVTGSPYIHHPMMVSYLAANYKKSSQLHVLIAAALLHDTIEDTSTTFEEIESQFGSMVASIVKELTNNKEKVAQLGKKSYLLNKMLTMSNYALYLKLVDRLANILDVPTEQYKKDTLEIILSLESNRALTQSQMNVVKDIKSNLN